MKLTKSYLKKLILREIKISLGGTPTVEEELGDGKASVAPEDNPYITAGPTSYVASHDLADGGTASISETSGDEPPSGFYKTGQEPEEDWRDRGDSGTVGTWMPEDGILGVLGHYLATHHEELGVHPGDDTFHKLGAFKRYAKELHDAIGTAEMEDVIEDANNTWEYGVTMEEIAGAVNQLGGGDNLEESRKKLTKHSLRSLIEKEIKKFGKKYMFEAWQGRTTDTAYAFHDKYAGEAKKLLEPLLEMGDNLAVIEKFIDLVSERVAFKNTTGSELHYTDIERVMESPVINALLVDDEGAEEFKNTFVGEAATLLGVDISSESEI